MLKFIFKLIAVIVAVSAAVVGFAYWNKNNEPDYIEIYSDDEDDTF